MRPNFRARHRIVTTLLHATTTIRARTICLFFKIYVSYEFQFNAYHHLENEIYRKHRNERNCCFKNAINMVEYMDVIFKLIVVLSQLNVSYLPIHVFWDQVSRELEIVN